MTEIVYNVTCYGEILWDVLPSGEKPGGAPMNVAYHLQKLGFLPAVITRTGRDEYGRRLAALLQQQGITTTYVQQDDQYATGVVNAAIRANGEVTYDIVQPVAWDFIEWEPHFSDLVSGAEYFVFGSLITRSRTSRETLFRLLEVANTKVLDINLRPPHFTQSMVETLIGKADILKLNEHELPLIAGWYKQLSSLKDQVQLIQDRFNVSAIVVTRGAEGALLNKEGQVYEHPGYAVSVVDTVGSGDAFLAGFICNLANGKSPAEALQFANSLGAFIASKSGACPPYQVDEVAAFVRHQSSSATDNL